MPPGNLDRQAAGSEAIRGIEMATVLPPQTDIVRDEQGIVRRISHARSPYPPTGFVPAGPTSLANWYLERVGSLYGLEPDWLSGPSAAGNAADGPLLAVLGTSPPRRGRGRCDPLINQ